MRFPVGYPRRLRITGLILLSLLVSAAGLRALTPEELRCEYQINPPGLSTPRPRLSWWVTGPERGARQTAYQILVAGSREPLQPDAGDRCGSSWGRIDEKSGGVQGPAPFGKWFGGGKADTTHVGVANAGRGEPKVAPKAAQPLG